MRKALISLFLISGVFATAKAQGVQGVTPDDRNWCQGCTAIEKAQRAGRANPGDPIASKDLSTNGASLRRSPAKGNSVTYMLKLHFPVKNESDKKITRIIWDCTISNRETKAVIQTVTFVSTKAITPHKSAVLKEQVLMPMEQLQPTVPAGQAGQKPGVIEVDQNYSIKAISYADGTQWRP